MNSTRETTGGRLNIFLYVMNEKIKLLSIEFRDSEREFADYISRRINSLKSITVPVKFRFLFTVKTSISLLIRAEIE